MEAEAKTNGALPYNRAPESESPLQGDIIVWHKPRNKWKNTHSIIINADCDLDKDNIPGFLTCIPVMGIETYLNDIWLKARIREEIEKETGQLAGVLNAALKRREELHKSISEGALEEIIHSKDPAPYLENMTFKAEKQKQGAIKDMNYIHKLTTLLTKKRPSKDKQREYMTLHSTHNNKSTKKCQTDLLSAFK